MPLTARVESGQSSPSLSTGGGVTAAVGVGVGGGACCAGGTTGVLTSGFSPGNGVAVAEGLVSVFLVSLDPVPTTSPTMAATMATTTTAIPIASALRRQ